MISSNIYISMLLKSCSIYQGRVRGQAGLVSLASIKNKRQLKKSCEDHMHGEDFNP